MDRLATVTTGDSAEVLRAWTAYALAGAVAVALGALLVSFLGDAATRVTVWRAALFAYVLQAVAFALLLRMRDQSQLFMVGWLGGMVLRFAGVAGLGFYASRYTNWPLPTLLLSLVGFVFLLLLLEPVFLRWDLRKS